MTYNPTSRVVIIGAGNVGTSTAFALLQQNFISKIFLIDTHPEKTEATALDLQDASNFYRGVLIEVADYTSIEDGDIVVIACGSAQQEGQTRMDLIDTNRKVITEVCEKLNQTKKNIYVILLTNPVDILTQHAIQTLNLDKGLVFGSGTYLDSIRLKNFLGKRLNLNPKSIKAYVLGEHGDSSFAVLSSTNVDGVDIANFLQITQELYTEANSKVRNQAYEIIKGKSVSCFGIAAAVVDMARSIILDEGLIFPLSVPLNGNFNEQDVCMGLPVKLSNKGFEYIVTPNLNDIEQNYLIQTIKKLKQHS